MAMPAPRDKRTVLGTRQIHTGLSRRDALRLGIGSFAVFATLRLWRGRLIEHFAERGAPFLAHGDLALRPTPTLYSPHYPKEARKG